MWTIIAEVVKHFLVIQRILNTVHAKKDKEPIKTKMCLIVALRKGSTAKYPIVLKSASEINKFHI